MTCLYEYLINDDLDIYTYTYLKTFSNLKYYWAMIKGKC